MNTMTKTPTPILDISEIEKRSVELHQESRATTLENILYSSFIDIASNSYNVYWSVKGGKATLLLEYITKNNLELTKEVTPLLVDSLGKISEKTTDIFNDTLKGIAKSYAENDSYEVASKVNDLILELLHLQLLIKNNLKNELGAWEVILTTQLETLNLSISEYIDYVKPLKDAFQTKEIN